jgi:hypothetical protein
MTAAEIRLALLNRDSRLVMKMSKDAIQACNEGQLPMSPQDRAHLVLSDDLYIDIAIIGRYVEELEAYYVKQHTDQQ